MGKTNFTKVEEALLKGLDEQAMKKLLLETDKTKEHNVPDELRLLLRHIQHDLRWLLKHDKDLHEKLKINKADLTLLITQSPEALSQDDWVRIHHLHIICGHLKSDLEKKLESGSDKVLIRRERRRHINRRFNISDKWLPLQ